MLNEHSQKGHLLSRVLEDDAWVIRLTAQAVGCHHHGQVADVHFGYGYVGWLHEHLSGGEQSRERRAEWRVGVAIKGLVGKVGSVG